MSNKEKFNAFKNKMIKDNEEIYGEEIRKKYGEDVVNKSNDRVKNMSEGDFQKINQIQIEFIDTLQKAYALGDYESQLAKQAVELHKKWLCFYWGSCSKEAHEGVTQMYVNDERFKKYYEKYGNGITEFLRDIVIKYYANY